MKCQTFAITILLTPLYLSTLAKAFNPSDVEQLRQTVSCVECDLSAVQLPDALLSNMDLRGADLRNADLKNTTLKDTKLNTMIMPDGRFHP